ncbi:MAG: hypothetical protein LC104_13920 [Bacteroidales bacterium]|nr:hypothetical protein [Bacteroidales bacterium]
MRSSPPTGEQRRLKAVILRKQAAQDTVVAQSIDFGIRLLPLVGAVSDFLDGNYTESAISLAGDVAMLTGFGVALKARRCVVTAKDLTKIVYRTSTAVEAGITGFRLGQGVNAYANDDTAAAYRYFGDATLRLLGLSAQSVAWLKNKPKCFVAGTSLSRIKNRGASSKGNASRSCWQTQAACGCLAIWDTRLRNATAGTIKNHDSISPLESTRMIGDEFETKFDSPRGNRVLIFG